MNRVSTYFLRHRISRLRPLSPLPPPLLPTRAPNEHITASTVKWTFCMVIGVATAFLAWLCNISVENIAASKFVLAHKAMHKNKFAGDQNIWLRKRLALTLYPPRSCVVLASPIEVRPGLKGKSNFKKKNVKLSSSLPSIRPALSLPARLPCLFLHQRAAPPRRVIHHGSLRPRGRRLGHPGGQGIPQRRRRARDFPLSHARGQICRRHVCRCGQHAARKRRAVRAHRSGGGFADQ